jgi:hypothetical protein
MKTRGQIASAMLVALAVMTWSGCMSRPISNAGYRGGYYGGGSSLYRGELSQLDVLGEGRNQPISDSDINAALQSDDRVKLTKRGSILLVQSGAIFPDDEMTVQFNRHGLKTVPFSGVPEESRVAGQGSAPPTLATSYAKALRLTAARGGCETIVCYWGVLESASKGLATKTISWTPIVGMAVPDETQLMRIRLMVALVDVRTGNWAVFTPAPFEDKSVSTSLNREASDQTQVQKLKQLAYERAVAEMVSTYGN